MAATDLTNSGADAGAPLVPGKNPQRLAGLSSLPESLNRSLERFTTLSNFHKIGVMLGLAAFLTVLVVAWLWSRPAPAPYHILYGGLAESDSAQVVEALQKNNIPHRIDPNSGVLTVPADQVHATRIKLAGLGLPKKPPIGGFEILDNQSPFGNTQFMEGARYQRALEGELAHSILTLGAVQSARVHLALPRPSVFVRDREKPSASVVLQLQPGRYLDRSQVEAIVHLVASSIPQLEPGRVTVVDQNGELLSRENSAVREMDLTKAQFDHVRRVEDSYMRRIERILAPLAGINGVRAQVTVDMDFSNTEHTREVYNPDQPSLRSEQTLEEQGRGLREYGIPGALSNQPPAAGTVPESLNSGGPPPEAGKGITTTTSSTSAGGELVTNRRHATRNYEVDRTISHTRNPVGQIRRISAAVVLDDVFYPNNPAQRVSRSPEEMNRIRTLVREAIGFDSQRGDTVSVVNLPFLPDFEKEPIIDETPLWQKPWAIEFFRQGLAALLVLALILGVLRPVARHFVDELEKPEEFHEDEEPESPQLESKEPEPHAITEQHDHEDEGYDDELELEFENQSEDSRAPKRITGDDTRELRPAGEGAEITPQDEKITLTLPQSSSAEKLAALTTPKFSNPAIPSYGEGLATLTPTRSEDPTLWITEAKRQDQDALQYIRTIIEEDPQKASLIIKEWINADNPSGR